MNARSRALVRSAAAAALISLAALSRRSVADITNVIAGGHGEVDGIASAGPPLHPNQQSNNFQEQAPDAANPDPANLNFSGATTGVAGANASSTFALHAAFQLGATADTLTAELSGSASATASASPSTPDMVFSALASGFGGNQCIFTITDRPYDYHVVIGTPSTSSPDPSTPTDLAAVNFDIRGITASLQSVAPFNRTQDTVRGVILSGSDSGRLQPGHYDFIVGTNATRKSNGTSNLAYDVTLNLTPIPEIRWTNTAGGSFQTDTNWDPNQVPGSSDAVAFDAPGSYTVSLDQDVSNAWVRFNGNGTKVNLDLSGHHYSAGGVVVGGKPGDNLRVTFLDSSIVVAARGLSAGATAPISLSVPGNLAVRGGGQLEIAVPTSSNSGEVDGGGTLVAANADAQWLVQTLTVGSAGAGNLSLSNKAIVTSTSGVIGVGGSAAGTVTVSGTDTTWTSGSITVGNQATGTLNVRSNGTVSAANITVGAQAVGTGTITVDGSVLLQTGSGSLTVGGQGTGHLKVQNDGAVGVEDTLSVGAVGGGTGDVTVTSGGSVNALNVNIGSLGRGTVSVVNGGALFGKVSGRVVVGQNGNLNVTTSGQFHANTTLEVDGQMSIDPTAHAVVGGDTGFGNGNLFVGPGGTLLGSGAITVSKVVLVGGSSSFSGGILKPGHSPGTLTINGDLEQDPGSTIKIEIAGTDPSQFDVLNVTGNASFNGDLLLSFQDGFAPHHGDTFAFLNTAGTMTGSFANVHLHDLAPGFQFNLQPETGGTVALVALNDAVSSRIPGDANDDGKVDFSDLLILAQHFNQGGTYSTGDFNLDGTVDFTDLLTLAQHFGQAAQLSPVPEPTALVGLAAALGRVRRRTR